METPIPGERASTASADISSSKDAAIDEIRMGAVLPADRTGCTCARGGDHYRAPTKRTDRRDHRRPYQRLCLVIPRGLHDSISFASAPAHGTQKLTVIRSSREHS